jgi:Protein of unknown function (DUF3160)
MRSIIVSISAIALLLAGAACGPGGSAGPSDGGSDAAAAAGADDAGADAGDGADAGLDGGADAGLDGGADAGLDAGADAGADGGLDAGPDGGIDAGVDAGPDTAVVSASLGTGQLAELARLEAVVSGTDGLTADALLASHAVQYRSALGYDPLQAVNFDLLQRSPFALNAAELAVFAKAGFVVSERLRFPHFASAYQAIYQADLPVYLSADSILQAVHQSFDKILAAVERGQLLPELTSLLATLRARLPAARLSDPVRADLDLYLTVAASLLGGSRVPVVAGASEVQAQALYDAALAAAGPGQVAIFGEQQPVDFTQFAPRSHYADDPALRQYFRALMWLGRIEVPLLREGGRVLSRRGVAAAFGLRQLMDDGALARFSDIDKVLRAFVGEADSMTFTDLDALAATLGLANFDPASVADQALAQALVAGRYGQQRILSQLVEQGPHAGTLPLDAVFLFLGQRYVFDSQVLSNVVYDRVNTGARPLRMMPDPLDVAYAALGNDQAAALLAPGLAQYPGYPAALESMRLLAAEHGADFWEANLYNRWLQALRALSPGAATRDAVPAVAGTEAWGRRLLQTQLASWAQLRHDTLLYAKPSYSSPYLCQYPDAYVDPYPAFFDRLVQFAQAGAALAGSLHPVDGSGGAGYVAYYFSQLGVVAALLRDMAANELTGAPHTAEQLAFINRAVSLAGCGGPPAVAGWYADLFYDPYSGFEFSPTIADVHTQPTDEAGNTVGRVLHVATGHPRALVMTADTCSGPRAFVGPVFSYHEVVTGAFQRLDDAAWATGFEENGTPADVPWVSGIVVR